MSELESCSDKMLDRVSVAINVVEKEKNRKQWAADNIA